MPVQTQTSSFAKKLGGRVVQAHLEHKDKPVDTGDKRLPSGIKDGRAKISAMYCKEYQDDKNGPGTKGQVFFRASAVAITPEFHNGEKVAGGITSIVIPLCDMPAKGQRKAKSFSENWYEFQNLFKLLGIQPPNETQQTDPTGQRTEAYYFAAMKTLTDPTRPVYISFSTRGWTPPPTPQNLKPTEMVFEDWHGLADMNEKHDPAAGVTVDRTQPSLMTPPPTPSILNPKPNEVQTESFNEFLPGTPEQAPALDQADIVATLVEVAMNDPEGATEEGANASAKLEEMAWANGWTKEQTATPQAPFTNDWAGVGDMALTPPTAAQSQFTNSPTIAAAAAATPSASEAIAVGSKHKFAKRTKDGVKLKDGKGTEFPPQEVEITSINATAKTCTVKTVKDGKDVVDIRTKQPVAIKFEWLE